VPCCTAGRRKVRLESSENAPDRGDGPEDWSPCVSTSILCSPPIPLGPYEETDRLKPALLALATLAATLTGCLSKSEVATTHYFRPKLVEITEADSLGTRPLRFDGIHQPLAINSFMTWRVSETELGLDEQNVWAREPGELLEEHLRDLLFGVGGFRDSTGVGAPTLTVQLTVFEGDVSGPEALAVLELIVDLDDGNDVHHRTRLRVEEPIQSRTAAGLAAGMGPAIGSGADRCARWLRSKLSGR
jgi:uncharacterized lipoprotein YmbA